MGRDKTTLNFLLCLCSLNIWIRNISDLCSKLGFPVCFCLLISTKYLCAYGEWNGVDTQMKLIESLMSRPVQLNKHVNSEVSYLSLKVLEINQGHQCELGWPSMFYPPFLININNEEVIIVILESDLYFVWLIPKEWMQVMNKSHSEERE